jgi:hypothetical protein
MNTIYYDGFNYWFIPYKMKTEHGQEPSDILPEYRGSWNKLYQSYHFKFFDYQGHLIKSMAPYEWYHINLTLDQINLIFKRNVPICTARQKSKP